MRGSRERKLFAAILALALVSLAVDRLFLGGGSPQALSAAPPTDGGHEVAAPAPERDDGAPFSDVADVRAHLGRLADERQIDFDAAPSAFTPGPAWGASEDAPVSRVRRPADFRQAHRLQGILVSPGGPTAIVDDTALRTGEELDGAVLRLVQPRAVVFDLDGVLITLSLDD